MSRTDIIRFYAATPVWFWPVLAWNLFHLLRALERRGDGHAFLVRILTDGRGRLLLEWISRPTRPSLADLSHNGPPVYELFDLDLLSGMAEGRGLFRLASRVRCVAGKTLARLIKSAGFLRDVQPEPG